MSWCGITGLPLRGSGSETTRAYPTVITLVGRLTSADWPAKVLATADKAGEATIFV